VKRWLPLLLMIGCASPTPHHWPSWKLALYQSDLHECHMNGLIEGDRIRAKEEKIELDCMKKNGWWWSLKYCREYGHPTESAPGVCTSRPPAS
jgi:hypothetical protein